MACRIVKKIIEEHGGTLTLEDAPAFDGNDHRGAMAAIRLPRLTRRRAGLRNRRRPGKVMTNILITDDEKDIRELIGDILRDEGFAVRLAANSDECMEAINAEPPALMISGHLAERQPDGRDRVLKTVKRDNPDIPIVIISGHGNIEIAVAAIKQGAYDFIEKPFNIDQLMVVVPVRWKPAVCAAKTPICDGEMGRHRICWGLPRL